MSETETVIRRSRPYSDRLATVGFLVALISGCVYLAQPFNPLRAPLTLVLLVALIYSVRLAVALYRTGTGDLSVAPFVIGAIFVTGGVGLDGVATLSATPTLEDEGNPVARALLAAELPVRLVVIVGMVAECLFASLVCMLWAAFLRHRKTLVASAWSRDPRSMSEFIAAAVGAGDLLSRPHVLPHSAMDLPSSYHVVWFMTAGLVGSHLLRWYLGLSCLDCFAWPLIIVFAVSVGLPLTVYFVWLGREYSKGRVDGCSRHPAIP
jgi:hypothetical protein